MKGCGFEAPTSCYFCFATTLFQFSSRGFVLKKPPPCKSPAPVLSRPSFYLVCRNLGHQGNFVDDIAP